MRAHSAVGLWLDEVAEAVDEDLLRRATSGELATLFKDLGCKGT